jgi:hypothetical protein
MTIRIRISFLMPIPGLESKRCRSTCGSYPQVYACWKIGKSFACTGYSKQRQFTMFFLSHQRPRCHDFKFFWAACWQKLWKKVKKLQYMSLEKMPIEIRWNDADPTRTGFRIHNTVCGNQCCGSMTFWCGSGSADPCLWLMDPDRILLFSSLTVKMPTKNKFKKKVFLHIIFWRFFYIIFQK